MVKVSYSDLRKEHSEQEVYDFFYKKGFPKEQIMQNEFAYKQTNGLIDYPEKKTDSLQDWFLNHESVNVEKLYQSMEESAEGYKKAVQEGYNESVTGMILNRKTPEESTADFTTGQEVVKGVTNVLSDVGVYGAGELLFTLGTGGNPVTGTAGAFAFHSYARNVLMQLYKDGEINSYGELMERLEKFGYFDMWRSSWEGFKGAVTGGAVGKAGQISQKFSKQIIDSLGLKGTQAKSLEMLTELSTVVPTLVGAESLLNLKIPTKDDFIDAAAVILGLKGIHAITRKILPKRESKEKTSAEEFREDVERNLEKIPVTYNPNWQQEVRKDIGSNVVYTINNKEIESMQGNIAGWLMDYYAETGKTPREAVAEIKENPAKIIEISGHGDSSYVIWSGNRVPVKYEVVEADTLKTSHDSLGNKNEDFPDYLQNRERDRSGSREQVNRISSNFIPEFVTSSYDPQTGAPIVTKDGYVIAGNGRLEAIKMAKEKGTQGNYIDFAASINPDAINMKNPVIVRRLSNDYSEDELRSMVQSSNQATTLRLSKSESAKDDATRIDDSLLDMLNTDSELSSVENRGFIDSALNKIVPENEKASLLDKDGKITNEGINRINNALLANVIKDERMLSKFIETEDPILKKVSSGLAKSSPAIVRLENDIREGRIKSSYSIENDINEAVFQYDKFKKSNMSFNDFIKQGDLYDKPTPVSEALLKIFQSSKGANVIKDIINDYTNVAAEQSGGFSFDLPEMTKADILTEAYKRRTGKSDVFFTNFDKEKIKEKTDEKLKEVEKINTDNEWEERFGGYSVEEVREQQIVNDFEKETYARKIAEGKSEKQAIIETVDESVNRDSSRLNTEMREEKNIEQAKYEAVKEVIDEPRKLYEIVKVNPKNDEITDILFGDSAKPVHIDGLTKSDIYVADKSLINVSYSGNTKIKPISLADISDNFKKRFDVAYKKGKMYTRGSVRGFYKPHKEVIRTRGYNDLSVLVHETAHHLDKKIFKNMQTLSKGEEKDYMNELGTIATKGNPMEEGFAEFVSYYVMNPKYVKENTPKFYSHFVEYMKKNEPQILKILDETQKDVEAWRLQPSDVRIRGQISERAKESGINVMKTADDLYTQTVDESYPLLVFEKAIQKIAKEHGKDLDLKPSERPYLLARLYKGIQQKISNYLEVAAVDKDFKRTGESLKDIYGKLKGKEIDTLNLYLTAKHALEINANGKESGIGNKDAEIVVKNIEEKTPKFKEYAERVRKYIDGLMKYAIDSGLVSQQAYEQMKKKYPFYVPFNRAVPKDNKPIARRLAPSKAIMKLKGSDLQVLPIHENLINLTANIIANADKNEIMNKIADLALVEGSGRYIEKVPSKQRVGLPTGTFLVRPNEGQIRANTVELTDPSFDSSLGMFDLEDEFWVKKPANQRSEITVLRDGEPAVYEVSEEFANAINNLMPADINLLTKIFSIPASTLRIGSTITSEFIGMNAIRDDLEAFINSTGLYIPVVGKAEGLLNMLFRTEDYREWQNAGGSLSNFVPRDRGSVQKKLKKIAKNYNLVRSTGYAGAAWNQIKEINPVNAAVIASEITEYSGRVGVYKTNKRHYKKYGEKRGWSDRDIALMSAFESREGTIDFARIGAKMRGYNAVTAFANAKIQGNDKMVRNLMNKPVKTLTALSLLMLASTYFLFASDGDKDIETMNKTIKDTNWVFRGKDGIIKLPKPQNAVPFLTMYERGITSDKGFWNGIKEAIIDYADMSMWDYIPTLIAPIVEVERNTTTFFNTRLIPASMERLMPEYQVTPYTSETAKIISKDLAKYGIQNKYTSPIVLDQIVRDYFGGTGRYVKDVVDYIITGKQKEDIYKYEHTPFFRAFRVAYTPKMSQPYEDFMKKTDDIAKRIYTAKYLLKKDPEDTTYLDDTKYSAVLQYRQMIVDLGKQLIMLQEQKNMTLEEKRQQADQINRNMIEFAELGLLLIKNIDETN